MSVAYATAAIGGFYLLTFILGFGAMVLVGQPAIRAVDAGGNMAAPLLAEAVGGQAFLGFISAVAFATILAVVAGLTLAGAAALSHDIYVHVFRGGRASEKEELMVARGATILLAVLLDRARHRLQGPERRLHGRAGVRDRRQRQLPGAGAVDVLERIHDARRAGVDPVRHRGHAGADLSVADDSDRPAETNRPPYFPYRNPGLFTIPLSFIVGIVVSLVAPEPAAIEGFARLEHQIHVGEEEPV